MATQEEVAQRRREKILARATDDDKGDEAPTGQSAFDRYKDIKQREKAQVPIHDI